MVVRYFRNAIFIVLYVFVLAATSCAQQNGYEQHALVVMRMIGHKVLLYTGDSVSRVLPIENEAGRYKIQFETDFQFNPSRLASIIDSAVADTKIADNYIVEVEECATGQVMYSYEIGNPVNKDIVPCRAREQPTACYSLYITILDKKQLMTFLEPDIPDLIDASASNEQSVNNYVIGFLIIISVVIVLLLAFSRRRTKQIQEDPNLIFIGQYQFDKRSAQLSHGQNIMELTGKEADLLLLLYDAVNQTVEREDILKKVWGDEGDYIGRTLDVFVSKLRKKLEADSNVRIVSIRGVGYKLVYDR